MDKEKELSEQIKDTLAGYEEEYVAGAWENFARKQKYILKKEQNRRKRVVYIRYAAGLAACLLLGIVLLNTFKKEQPAGAGSPLISVITNSSKTSAEKSLKADPDKMHLTDPNQTISGKTDTRQAISKQAYNQQTHRQQVLVKHAAIQQTTAQQVAHYQTSTQQKPIQKATTQQATTPNQQTTAANPPTNTPPPTAPQQAIAANNPTDNADNRISPTPTYTTTEKSPARKVRFGINVAQGINSTATSTAFNYSGGVNVDVPLSKTLALSTGIQIENQTVESKSTISNTAIPSDNRRANIINLDFPLNIKWKFLSRKSGSYYIAGGISSLAYLSEKYMSIARKQELREVLSFMGSEETRTYKLENVETTTTNTAGASNQFDIAGRLNISIGFEKQISPTLYLHIEPFMKIPVSGLASENLIFTTSGITFKISF